MSNKQASNQTFSSEPAPIRQVPLKLSSSEFRALGHKLVDRLADFFEGLPVKSLPSNLTDTRISQLIEGQTLPDYPQSVEKVLDQQTELLCNYAISTSHPRFLAYIMGASTPLAALSDLLASAISPPMTSYATSKLTVAIEAQTIQWMANLLGYPNDCSGLFLSGGSIANFVAVQVGMNHAFGPEIRQTGLTKARAAQACFYASFESHSSLIAAAEMSGLGRQAVRLVKVDASGCMDIDDLICQINADRQNRFRPFMVVGTAGTTSRGAIDPLARIATICKNEDLWFHVDGAYGAAAIVSPEAPAEIRNLCLADSLVIDPHKWLYLSADVGCFLTQHPKTLFDTFNQRAVYYASDTGASQLGGLERLQFRDLGPQTTRAFRALRVRLSLMTAGREGYSRAISEDIILAKKLFYMAEKHLQLEALTSNLSITNFRYIPIDLKEDKESVVSYLNKLNWEILCSLKATGKAYPSHTFINGVLALRVCIVNYHTTVSDIELLIDTVVEIGSHLHESLNIYEKTSEAQKN